MPDKRERQKIFRVDLPSTQDYSKAIRSYASVRPSNVVGPYSAEVRHFSEDGAVAGLLAQAGMRYLMEEARADRQRGLLKVTEVGIDGFRRTKRPQPDNNSRALFETSYPDISLETKRHELSYLMANSMFETRGADIEYYQLQKEVADWLETLPDRQVHAIFGKQYNARRQRRTNRKLTT